jgi:proline iminopeptidase
MPSPGTPHQCGHLRLDDIHTMYFEEWGAPDGVPVVVLHGGPGAGMDGSMRERHDLMAYRVVMFDQRGSGRSTPAGEIRQNELRLLLQDIEHLRSHLGIASWVVSGGSWGTTLALAYAQRFPQHCLALVLRGVFLGSDEEIDWFSRGLPKIWPQEWRDATSGMSAAERVDFLATLRRDIAHPDRSVHGPAAVKMATYEWACASVEPDAAAIAAELTEDYCIPYQRVGAHYMAHHYFLAPGELLRGVQSIRHLPCFIVNGRFDIVCPPHTAFALHEAWPESELHIVPRSGHSATEPLIASTLDDIMGRLADRFKSAGR